KSTRAPLDAFRGPFSFGLDVNCASFSRFRRLLRGSSMPKHLSSLILLLILAPVLAAQQAPPQLDALKREAVEETDKMQTFTQQMVDQIFSYSELGFQEIETSRYVTGLLEKNGFKVEKGIAGVPTAWVATYGSVKPVIAFITDEDCIPRASQKPGVAYHD